MCCTSVRSPRNNSKWISLPGNDRSPVPTAELVACCVFIAPRGKEGYDCSEATFQRLMTIDPVTCIGRKTDKIEKRWRQKKREQRDMCCRVYYICTFPQPVCSCELGH